MEDSIASTSKDKDTFQLIWNDYWDDHGWIRSVIEELVSYFYTEISPKFVTEYMNVFSRHGIYLIFHRCSLKVPCKVLNIPVRDFRKPQSVHQLFRDISAVTAKFNVNTFLHRRIKSGLSKRNTTEWKYQNEWFGMWKLFLTNDQFNLESLIGSSLLHQICQEVFTAPSWRRHMKKFVYTEVQIRSNLFSDASLLFLAALQIALQNLQKPIVELSLQITQLSHVYLVKVCDLTVHSDVTAQMTESLLCLFILNQRDHCDEIDALVESLKPNKKHMEFSEMYKAYKMVVQIHTSSFQDSSVFTIEAERLSDMYDDEQFGISCTVFVEAACFVFRRMKSHTDAMIELITNVCKEHPSLTERMLMLAEVCKIPYAVEGIIDDACSGENLEASSPVWIDWCTQRLKNITRYGPILPTIRKCLHVLFSFLDFGENKNHEVAWATLHEVVQKASVEMVKEEWESRKSWWLAFHNNTRRKSPKFLMSEDVMAKKEEVLKALSEL